MSKGKNSKSGLDLANAIIKNCKNEFSDEEGRDYAGNFKRNFCENFLTYFETITDNKISFGDIPNEIYEKLKKNLVKITEDYEINKLHKWFKVKSWKDLFANDLKDAQEWKFKSDIHSVLIDLYKEMIDNQDETMISNERLEVRKLIYDLMLIDSSYYYKNGVAGDKKRQVLENATKHLQKRRVKRREKQREEDRKESNKIVKRYMLELMKKGVVYQSIESFVEDDFKLGEFIQWCHGNFWKDRAHINIENLDNWIKEQEEEFKKMKKEEYLARDRDDIIMYENRKIVECLFRGEELNCSSALGEEQFKKFFDYCKKEYQNHQDELSETNLLSWVEEQREKMEE